MPPAKAAAAAVVAGQTPTALPPLFDDRKRKSARKYFSIIFVSPNFGSTKIAFQSMDQSNEVVIVVKYQFSS